MKRFIDWIKSRFGDADSDADEPLWHTGARAMPTPVARKPKPKPVLRVEFSADVGGRIADGGPGKNVLIRNKYVREDTGTHETLRIVDDSLLQTDDEFGADPYNTGRFDRSKSWDSSRSRK